MTAIVDIEDELSTLITAALPAYQSIADAYVTGDNTNLNLEKGFSIGFGPGRKVTNDFCLDQVDIEREMFVALTNDYVPNYDHSYRNGLEEDLMNDQFALISAVEKNPTLNQNCIVASYESDQGIDYLSGEDGKQYIIILTTFTVRYIEGVV